MSSLNSALKSRKWGKHPFLEDSWIGGRPLNIQFPSLYNKIFKKEKVSVAMVKKEGWGIIKFINTLLGEKLRDCNK